MLVSSPALDPPSTAADAAARAPPVSLDAFLAEIGPRAFRFAEAGLRQREDALDAVQDAMVKLLAYRERPAQEWTPLFWSILRRRIVDLQRRRGFRLRFWAPPGERGEDGHPDWADTDPGPAQHHAQRQTHARLVAALRALPARQREAFTLRVLEELDVATTACAMGCSEGSVKTHLSRAREALQKRLENIR
ncbi:RNA polymerase sigma factor [Xanthomonas theicola]|uniref:RNA polymerase sigma factor n=1 Tax=Xanthomonas theicola TaxID=56464 RepID=A0A2S6ZEF1_9XANT|nr:RNA polymerase sigma factor [Xanthomonas theicola]PPT90647.1 RNA polymerase sigma factor [Xanthomonas theicola]QNH26883.1 RNA polymerase sigma factor [Xanthomonas theicola]